MCRALGFTDESLRSVIAIFTQLSWILTSLDYPDISGFCVMFKCRGIKKTLDYLYEPKFVETFITIPQESHQVWTIKYILSNELQLWSYVSVPNYFDYLHISVTLHNALYQLWIDIERSVALGVTMHIYAFLNTSVLGTAQLCYWGLLVAWSGRQEQCTDREPKCRVDTSCDPSLFWK